MGSGRKGLNMTVAKLKERYAAIQKEAAGIEAEIKPLLKRLRSLSRRGESVGHIMDSADGIHRKHHDGLYRKHPDGLIRPNGWNVQAHCRMDELGEELPVFIAGIKQTLSNIRHTPFKERSPR